MRRLQPEFRTSREASPLLAEQLQIPFGMPTIRYSVTASLIRCLSPDPVQPNLPYVFRFGRTSVSIDGREQHADDSGFRDAQI
ncbi:MAG TPA: hypothetical protein VFL15_10385 [Gammaproteobacteria bacterium]|nr:hypothetical protein [Gammaproteobacteria bacterium]